MNASLETGAYDEVELLKLHPINRKSSLNNDVALCHLFDKGIRSALVRFKDGKILDNACINKQQIDMTEKEEVLKACTVENNIVKLPDMQLERKMYADVKKALELIGGKWKGGKVSGFVFATDPTDLLNQVANGEKRNLKKDFQFFATPDKLADELEL